MLSRTRSGSQDKAIGAAPDREGEGFHDPLAGVGGLAPARSALTLRAILAGFGFAFCSASAVGMYLAEVEPWVVGLFVVLAIAAVVDLAVILRRKRRGEPG